MQRTIDTHSQEHGHECSHRLGPVIRRRQQRGMEGQHQIQHGHGPVQDAPGAVGEFFPERDHKHQQQGIEGPFPHVFCQVAQNLQKSHEFFLWQAAFTADRGLEDIARHFDQPMQRSKGDGQNAGPLVRAIDAVHAPERDFEPGGPGGQVHGQRHHGNRQQTAEVQRFLACDPQGVGACRRGGAGEIQAPGKGHQRHQATEQCFHGEELR